MRIYVSVPQNYSALIHHGLTAKLTVPEYPGQTFTASVVNDAQSVGRNGAMLVELQIDNADGKLKPGAYAQVAFGLPPPQTTTKAAIATAILFKHDGPTVAVVGADGHVKIRPITIARDLGTEVEIGSGLRPAKRSSTTRPRPWSTAIWSASQVVRREPLMRAAKRLLLVAAAASVLAACASAPPMSRRPSPCRPPSRKPAPGPRPPPPTPKRVASGGASMATRCSTISKPARPRPIRASRRRSPPTIRPRPWRPRRTAACSRRWTARRSPAASVARTTRRCAMAASTSIRRARRQ
jgi:hypothetical protein